MSSEQIRKFMQIVESAAVLREAPVGDYVRHGDFGEPSSFGPKDARIIASQKAEQKIRRRFGKTPHVFDLHFVNQPGGTEHWHGDFYAGAKSEHNTDGEVTSQEVKKAFGVTITPKPNTITFIFAGNEDFSLSQTMDDSDPLEHNDPVSAWVIAHRFIHSVEFDLPAYKIYRAKLPDLLGKLGVACRQQNSRSTLYGDLSRALFTMKSARDQRLNEIEQELATQYIMTGRVRLHRHDTINPYMRDIIVVTDPARFDAIVAQIEPIIDGLIKNILDEAVGKMFII